MVRTKAQIEIPKEEIANFAKGIISVDSLFSAQSCMMILVMIVILICWWNLIQAKLLVI